MSAIELSDRQLEALADRIAVKLAALQALKPEAELLTAEQFAAKLGVSTGYVRAHADELGVIRIGSGPKPRLRFRADAAMPAPVVEERAKSRPRRTEPTSGAGSVLTIRGGKR